MKVRQHDLNGIKKREVKRYKKMIKYAKKQPQTEAPSYEKMFSDIGTHWGPEHCEYCNTLCDKICSFLFQENYLYPTQLYRAAKCPLSYSDEVFSSEYSGDGSQFRIAQVKHVWRCGIFAMTKTTNSETWADWIEDAKGILLLIKKEGATARRV